MKPAQFIELTAYEGHIPSELSADYILPDTYPDVKKILRVCAKPVLIGRYISGKRLEFSGAVDYKVLFSADTENGESIHAVHFAGEWSGSLPDIESIDTASVCVIPTVSACTVRLANPRKLTIKSTVSTYARISVPCPVAPSIEGTHTAAEEASLERLGHTVTARRERTFLADVLRISENLEPDASQPAIDEIISCGAQIYLGEAKINANDLTVALKGAANVNCIYKPQGEAGVYRSFSRRLPIAYIVDASEYTDVFAACRAETLCARALATTVEINAEVGENSYGERRMLELDVSADVNVSIVGGEDVPVVLDAYSLTRETECITREYTARAPGKMLCASFSVGESLGRSELAIPENAKVIDTEIEIVSPGISVERGRLLLTASAVTSSIIEADGSFSGISATIPIKCELSAGEVSEPLYFAADLTASDVRVRLDNERIYFDFEVSLCAEICERSRNVAVSAVRFTGECKRTPVGATLTLCYPTESDTLWQIAKRYKTTVAAIEAANADVSGVLLIPSAI